MHHQYLSPSLQLYFHLPLSVSQPYLICCGLLFFFFFYDVAYRMHLYIVKRVSGGTPIALWRLGKNKNFVSKERMFVIGKQIKKIKIKRALQMIYFFL
jgi:hypothetical protein